jgi:hypothetical protein
MNICPHIIIFGVNTDIFIILDFKFI